MDNRELVASKVIHEEKPPIKVAPVVKLHTYD
jgi:hypothetical protein